MNLLRKKDKDVILFNLRKIGEDINKMELFFSDNVEKDIDKVVRWEQFIKNNKNRIRKLIWTVSGSSLREDIKEDFRKENKKF